MDTLPTVSTFCGCIDLKKGSVVVATIRPIINICVSIYFSLSLLEIEIPGFRINLTQPWKYVYCIILIIFSLAKVAGSCLFLKGVTSNNPAGMKCYLVLYAIDLFFYYYMLLNVSWWMFFYMFIFAIEIHLFTCAYSIYVGLLPEYRNNQTETATIKNEHNQPPSYGNAYEVEGRKVVTKMVTFDKEW